MGGRKRGRTFIRKLDLRSIQVAVAGQEILSEPLQGELKKLFTQVVKARQEGLPIPPRDASGPQS